MKKFSLTVIIVTAFIAWLWFGFFSSKLSWPTNLKKGPEISPTMVQKAVPTKTQIRSKTIFVPYWAADDKPITGYDRYIYFGITANYLGIDRSEAGYLKRDKFVTLTAGKDSLLTLRLLNDEFNKELLVDEVLQQKIIEETIEITKENNFSGIVLDLEIFSLFNADIKGQINNFVQRFYTTAKTNYKSLAITIYGDVFFRARPFDLAFIGKHSDEIFVMAYDFSKSRGSPGPNFPFDRRSLGEGGIETQIYDYDFQTMVKDFLKLVPADKLTVIFGMYGYDWMVDEKQRPIGQAKALSLNEIRHKFLNNCQQTNCLVRRDDITKETEIDYTISSDKPDSQNIYRIDYHIIWFEDEESVKVKTDYLQGQGIEKVGYWAWGYF